MSNQIERKTTILLADGQLMVRQGIRHLLEHEADFKVVGEADDIPETVRLTRELKPDVVVIQARRPGLGGAESIRHLKAEHPQPAVLILTMYEEEEYIAELLIAGAAGHLLKTARIEDLMHAIRSVNAGEFICSTDLAQRLLKRAARAQPVALNHGQHLTRRESEVLKLLPRMTNQEIAEHLGLTERTVKGHLTNIFQKMNVGSRTEAVLEALRRGWITIEDT